MSLIHQQFSPNGHFEGNLMIERKNGGYKVEIRFRRFFRGNGCCFDEADFETPKCLYEVKSCNLFNRCYNGNDKRPYRDRIHKKCITNQLGRFAIKTDNHIGLYLRALQTGKVPKYIFALIYENQAIFRVLEWDQVILTNDRERHYIRLADIFKEATPLETY